MLPEIKVDNVLQEIEDAYFNIPFENSDFQNEVFVVAAQITPERAYRAIGLRMFNKLKALKEYQFSERKREIEIGELNEKLLDPNLSKWDKMRISLQIEELNSNISLSLKLKNDAIKELNCLYKHFKSLPKFTREQFEAAEKNYFEQKLSRNILGIEASKESLVNINEDMPAILEYERKAINSLDHITSNELELLRLNMSNQIKDKNE